MKKLLAWSVVASLVVVGCKDDPGIPAPSNTIAVKPSAAVSAAPSPSMSNSIMASASAATHQAPLPPAGCVEPKSLKSHSTSEIAAILASDPIDATPEWRAVGFPPGDLFNDGITYHFGDNQSDETGGALEIGTIDAKKGAMNLFHLPGLQIAGGSVGLAISPKGTVLSRTYSRGSVELFDALTGKPIGTTGQLDFAFAPDESYAVVAPCPGPMTNQFDSTDVVVLRFGAPPSKKVIASWKPLLHEGDMPSGYGVAVCETGAVFATSHPLGELAIHRATDRTKVASLAKPPKGKPSFTRSGKWIVIGGDDQTNTGLFELVP